MGSAIHPASRNGLYSTKRHPASESSSRSRAVLLPKKVLQPSRGRTPHRGLAAPEGHRRCVRDQQIRQQWRRKPPLRQARLDMAGLKVPTALRQTILDNTGPPHGTKRCKLEIPAHRLDFNIAVTQGRWITVMGFATRSNRFTSTTRRI